MSVRRCIVALVAVGAGVLVACGDSASNDLGATSLDGGVDSGSSVDAASTDATSTAATAPPAGTGTEFCRNTIGVVPAALETCCSEADKTTTPYKLAAGVGGSISQSCGTRMEASIAKGRILYRADKVQTCYALFRQAYPAGMCAALQEAQVTVQSSDLRACSDAFVGVGAEGAPCQGDPECVDGLACVGAGKTTDGVCKKPPAVGELCGRIRDADAGSTLDLTFDYSFGAHPDCADGARCTRASSSDVQGKCTVAYGADHNCTSDDECASPLRCHLDKCSQAGPADLNGVCRRNRDCKQGFYCEGANSTTNGSCQPKKLAGGTCHQTIANTDSECIGRCDAPETIGSEGTCVSFCGSR